MKTISTRSLMEGSILAALTAIIGISYNMPIVGLITMFWPVPIILVSYRNNLKTSILSAVIAAFIIGLIVNPIIAFILLLVYVLPGSLMGLMISRKISPYITIFAGGLILASTAVLEFILMLEMLLGRSVLEIILNFGSALDDYGNYLFNIIRGITEIYRQLGIDESAVNQIIDALSASITKLMITLPSVLLLTGISVAYINFKVVRLILRRMGHSIEDLNRFSEWRLNEKLKVPMLLVTALTLGLNYLEIDFIQAIYANLFTLIMFVYGLLGLSVLVHFAEKASLKYEIPRPLLILFIVIFFIPFRFIFPFIGMFDLTANIRRVARNIHGGVQ